MVRKLPSGLPGMGSAVQENSLLPRGRARARRVERGLLQWKAIAIENDLRGTLRNFGLKVGMVGKVKFEARIKELLRTSPTLPSWLNPC